MCKCVNYKCKGVSYNRRGVNYKCKGVNYKVYKMLVSSRERRNNSAGLKIIKLSSSSLTLGLNKLECFTLASFSG